MHGSGKALFLTSGSLGCICPCFQMQKTDSTMLDPTETYWWTGMVPGGSLRQDFGKENKMYFQKFTKKCKRWVCFCEKEIFKCMHAKELHKDHGKCLSWKKNSNCIVLKCVLHQNAYHLILSFHKLSQVFIASLLVDSKDILNCHRGSQDGVPSLE